MDTVGFGYIRQWTQRLYQFVDTAGLGHIGPWMQLALDTVGSGHSRLQTYWFVDTVGSGHYWLQTHRFVDTVGSGHSDLLKQWADPPSQPLLLSLSQLVKASTAYGMEISAEKTKLMTNNTSGINTEIKVNGQKLDEGSRLQVPAVSYH